MGQLDQPGTRQRPVPILLVSTHAVDRIREGDHIHEVPGGPAKYVGRALERLEEPYRLVTGEVAPVDVLPSDQGEQYVIPQLPLIPLPARLSGRAVILSPIMREIDPNAVPAVEGLLALDLQGFVRQPSRPSNEPGPLVDMTSLLRRAGVVKASALELERLTAESRDALQETVLVITRGARGATVRYQGQEYNIAAEVVEVNNTIGAGDTFLAALVSALLHGKTPEEAARRAARFTEAILRERAVAEREP